MGDPPLDDDTFPLQTAAYYLNIGRKRMIRWVQEGRLPAEKRDGDYHFTRSDLFAFARQYCIECGLEHWEIEEGVFFCPHCASSFAPFETRQEFLLLDSLEQQRIQLFLMRIEGEIADDMDAVKRIHERFASSMLRSCQIWFAHRHDKRGVLRVGLGRESYDPADYL